MKTFEMRIAILCLATAFFLASNAGAATINAVNCSRTAVAAAISGATNGDTVVVPAGSCTWSSNISIANKDVTILGAGADNTVITQGAFSLTNSASRISGFTFNLNTSSQGFLIEGSVGWRIDHNTITASATTDTAINTFLTYGLSGRPVEGLFDHNTTTNFRMLYYGDESGGTTGNNRWAEPLGWGTSHYIYVEDNTMNITGASAVGYLNTTDGNWGCRYVIRFNRFLNGRVEIHSLQGDNQRACRAWEIYNNTWTNNSDPSYRQWLIRGGTGLIFHESADGKAMNNEIHIDNDRSHECSISSSIQSKGCSSGGANQVKTFGMCGWNSGGAQANGSSFIDGNVPGGYGYPCRDQIGRSTDAVQWSSSYTSPAPSQAFQPAYIWRNTDPRGEIPVGLNCENSGIPCSHQFTYHIVESRDYYTYRSSFNGTAGVGEGTLANRPATCRTGVAYWVTDQGDWNSNSPGPDGRLDVCTSTNTWTAGYYMPYTYPHPLQTGANTSSLFPPTNLRIQ